MASRQVDVAVGSRLHLRVRRGYVF
jgi:hypothetical protein